MSTCSDSDDDIPLGQTHPDALRAQALLRQEGRRRDNTTKKLGEEEDNQPLSFIKRLKSLSRGQGQKSPTHQPNNQHPISVELLTKKLQLVQHLGLKPSVLNNNKPSQMTRSKTENTTAPAIQEISPSSIDQQDRNTLLKRGNSTTQKPTPELSKQHHQQQQQIHPPATQPLSRAKSLSDRLASKRASPNLPPAVPLPPVPLNNHHNQHHHHHLTNPQPSNAQQQHETSKSPTLHLNTNHNTNHLSSQIHSPIELSPSTSTNKKKLLIKLAIVNQSQSIMVEITQDTLPKDLLKEAESSDHLIDQHTKGTWGVFEVWRDLEIERPVREIEKIMKIVETWTAVDTNETYLLIQKNEISGLSVSKRSFTSGVYGTNLWCELKPGKWTKKFVLLRDNAVYLCSNDKGKDEMFLCTMDKFDVYAIPAWAHKNLKGVPREYAFGLKSLNKFSFFETKSDFVHKFACKDKLLQLDWIRRLYDARSYIIMSQLGEEEMNRTKPVESQVQAEKTKPSVGLKRGRTLLVSQRKETFTGVSKQESRTEPINVPSPVGGGSDLTRKPTLVQPSMLTKFKQGTLLGNLEHPTENLPNTTNTTTTTSSSSLQQAILPSHVMPLINNNESQQASDDPTMTPVTTKGRTWEQMGPEERKAYLAQVQNQAKNEGKTLLNFTHDDSIFSHNPSSLLAARATPNTSSSGLNDAGPALNRSKTLGGNRHRRPRPAF